MEMVPEMFERNLKLMQDLNNKIQSIKQEINRLRDEYFVIAGTATPDELKKCRIEINELFIKAKKYGDHKLQLATETCQRLDENIEKFDSNSLFELETRRNGSTNSSTPPKTDPASQPFVLRTDCQPHKLPKVGIDGKDIDIKEDTIASASPPRQEEHKSTEVVTTSCGTAEEDVLQDPIYCTCRNVQHGEMIACDNVECPIEWFHIGCVKLNPYSIPKGKWYCRNCKPLRKSILSAEKTASCI